MYRFAPGVVAGCSMTAKMIKMKELGKVSAGAVSIVNIQST